MKSELELLQEQAWNDYQAARELIEKQGHITGYRSSLNPAHKLLEQAFNRWLKCEKRKRADKEFCPSDDDMAEYM